MHSEKYELNSPDCFSLKNINRIYAGEAEVFFADASEIDINAAGELLSEYRKTKINKIKKESEKKLSAGAELLLIYALKAMGYDFKLPLKYTAGEHGKLYFDDIKGLHFNLSHSGIMVACALCKNEIGIDIEKERTQNPEIADKYFTVTEKRMISERLFTFTDIWVRKEAAVKADGRGIAAGLINIDVSGDSLLLSGAVYRLYDINTGLCGYKLSVAVKQL